MVLLEGSFQPQQLRRGEGRSDALRLPGEGAVEQQAVLGHVVTWGEDGPSVPGKQVLCVLVSKSLAELPLKWVLNVIESEPAAGNNGSMNCGYFSNHHTK